MFVGSFPSKEEQATAVNSLIPTACLLQALMIQTPSFPGLAQPMCLQTWRLLPARELGYRMPRAPTAILQFPEKPEGQGSGLSSSLFSGSDSERPGGPSGALTDAFLVWPCPATACLKCPEDNGDVWGTEVGLRGPETEGGRT